MTFLNEEQMNSLNKESMAMIIKTLQGQIMLLDTTNKSDFLIRDILVRAQKKPLLLMDKYLSLIIIQNYSMKQRFLRMILKDLISMKSPSLTKGKRNLANEKLIYLIFQQGYSIILFYKEELNEKFPEGYCELPAEVYKRLFIIPETFMVDEHHVHTYKSKGADGTIIKANRPADVFRNSIATPSLIAAILTSKYGNHVPLDRQARSFNDNGINIATNTLANWVINSSDTYLSLLYERMHKCIYDSKYYM